MSDNLWLEKSIRTANDDNYLDQLQNKIYDVESPEDRELNEEAVQKAKKAYKNKNYEKLVKAFIQFDKFPYSDTYTAYLRHAEDDVFENNPKTVERIGKRIHEMGIDTALARSSLPKESNRQMGGKFEEWLHDLEYDVSYEEFDQQMNRGEIKIMAESSQKLLEYINRELHVDMDKEPDLLAKKKKYNNELYIIGEAKFLTGFGGHQGRQISDALNIAEKIHNHSNDQLIGVAIIDGVHLIEMRDNLNRKYQRKIRKTDANVLSALYLEDFLESL